MRIATIAPEQMTPEQRDELYMRAFVSDEHAKVVLAPEQSSPPTPT